MTETGRQLKKRVLSLLLEDPDHEMKRIRELPGKKVINPLFSFLYHPEESIKWGAVTAMGFVVSDMAETHMESARIIMRRLMWNLNDESGGIGWGSPEAMGEIMYRNEAIAGEYHRILVSYVRPDGNYLEHELLQRGLLWGLGRLSCARPLLASEALYFLPPFFTSKDPYLRGLAAWTAGLISPDAAILDDFGPLAKDEAPIRIFLDGKMVSLTVGDLAAR